MSSSHAETLFFRAFAVLLITTGVAGTCVTVNGLFELTTSSRDYIDRAEDQDEARSELVREGISQAWGFTCLIFAAFGLILLLASFPCARRRRL